jgi:UDP-N-acetylmuramoyl-tripeptide--D-alanyl-D-alanine ligase
MEKTSVLEYDDAENIVDWLKQHLTSTDAVLIKGSHGLRMERIVTALEVA